MSVQEIVNKTENTIKPQNLTLHCEHGVEILILTEWRQNTLKHSTFNADQGSEVQIEFGSAIAL